MQEKLENEMETTILGSGFLVGIAGVEGFQGGLDGQGYKVIGLGGGTLHCGCRLMERLEWRINHKITWKMTWVLLFGV